MQKLPEFLEDWVYFLIVLSNSSVRSQPNLRQERALCSQLNNLRVL